MSMRTIWNNPDKTELNLHVKRVGEIYEENKFTKADNEALNKIRQVTCDGLHETYVLLEMYLETKGMMIDKTTKEIKNKVKMNITEDYVSFETAKLLKENGFNPLNCGMYYSITTGKRTTELLTSLIACPTLQMVLKWLREAHQIYINIYERYSGNADNDINYSFQIRHWKKPVNPDLYDDGEFVSYEEAVEESIKYCLENLI